MTLDVSDAITAEEFAVTITVIRRAEVIDSKGRVSTVDQTFNNVSAVVTADAPSDLDRGQDYQTYSRSITIVTQFPLQGVTSGAQPDFIQWQGSKFIVKHVDLYPHFGAGFFQAKASSVLHQDSAATTNQNKLGLKFNTAPASQYIGAVYAY
jgi:hypothetical protein